MGASGRTIFLVDDDRDFLEMEKSILATGGWEVECFSDPGAALEAARARAAVPTLVITDLMMAELGSGFGLARAIKEDPALTGVRVIIVSAVASQKGFDFRPRSDADLAAMHADAFFDKPVLPAALLAKVKELLP